jgi:hypothetical protein
MLSLKKTSLIPDFDPDLGTSIWDSDLALQFVGI